MKKKKINIIKAAVIIPLLVILLLLYFMPYIIVYINCSRIDQLGEYLYINEDDEADDIVYVSEAEGDVFDIPDGMKTMLIVGCDDTPSNYGNYGADIIILITSQKSEIHIYSISRDIKIIVPEAPDGYLKLTDICRNYPKKYFISVIEETLHVPIDNYVIVQSKDKVVEKFASAFAPDGLCFELNEIELIGLNQIMLTTLSEEEQKTELFRDSSGNILGIDELNKLATPSEFVGFYTAPDSTVKIFPDGNGAPLTVDEKGETVNVSANELIMYIENVTDEDGIEYNGKHYVPCNNKDFFTKEAYSAQVYNINQIFGTTYSEAKKPVTLSPKQLQAFSRLRHSYLDQGVSRNRNVSQILSKIVAGYVKHPAKAMETLSAPETEKFFEEAGKEKMIQISCHNISKVINEMYPRLSSIQYGSYANVDGELIHLTFIPDPYHPLDEASLQTQMHWAVYGE
ncbi:MAG: hypothetical protein K5979_12430 [Ruminococcus sp.]|nr:hypothetical protein [Ruminococcus sp.]